MMAAWFYGGKRSGVKPQHANGVSLDELFQRGFSEAQEEENASERGAVIIPVKTTQFKTQGRERRDLDKTRKSGKGLVLSRRFYPKRHTVNLQRSGSKHESTACIAVSPKTSHRPVNIDRGQ